jgi:hypothetical protein
MDAKIPSELTGVPPRRVRATGNGIYATLMGSAFLAFALAAAIWAGANTVRQTENRAALRSDSSVIVGEITRTRKRKNSEIVYYTFNANSRSYTGEAELPWQLRNYVEQSKSITVRYLPTDPDVNHPAAWEWSFFWWLPLSTDLVHLPRFSKESEWFLASLMFAPFGFVLLMGLRSERRLLTEGMPVAGLVTGCTRGTRGSYRVKYEFRTEDGRVVQGKCGGKRQDIGAGVCVLYLRQDPRKNQLYSTGSYCIDGCSGAAQDLPRLASRPHDHE